MGWLRKRFHCEEINGGGRCATYLYRWIILSTRWLGVYLHHFVGDDWSRDMHDHPKRFVSIGLRGGYVEDMPRGSREYRAPWVRSFPATHTHRLRLGRFKDCWTLVDRFPCDAALGLRSRWSVDCLEGIRVWKVGGDCRRDEIVQLKRSNP